MKDVLTWSCSDNCNCENEGHIHYDDPRFANKTKVKPKSWFSLLFKR